MYRIGIIGPETCFKERKVKQLIFKIKETFGNTATIISGGNSNGIERHVKKTALEFELKYKEFNPSFTGQNLYSAMSESYYTKGKHPSHFEHRYNEMLKHIDKLFIGYDEGCDFKLYERIRKRAEKSGIKVVII